MCPDPALSGSAAAFSALLYQYLLLAEEFNQISTYIYLTLELCLIQQVSLGINGFTSTLFISANTITTFDYVCHSLLFSGCGKKSAILDSCPADDEFIGGFELSMMPEKVKF